MVNARSGAAWGEKKYILRWELNICDGNQINIKGIILDYRKVFDYFDL